MVKSMRLQTPQPPTSGSPDYQIWEHLRSLRPGGNLLPLDTALLHNPALAKAFYDWNGSLHGQCKVPLPLLSIAIVRIAVLCENSYTWNVHGLIALKRGVTPKVLNALRQLSLEDTRGSEIRATENGSLTQKEMAIVKYTDEVTTNVRVKTETFEILRQFLDDQEILELTVIIGEYNSVCRIILALEIGLDDARNRQWMDVSELEQLQANA